MKRYFFAFLLCLSSFYMKPQSVFAAIGSTWNYTWYEHTGAYQGPETLYYTGDTIIGGITHKKIAKAYSYSCMCPNPISGTQCCFYTIVERNDSIFDGNMKLQYSFSQPVGDSIVYNSGGGPSQYKIVLDSIKTQFICGMNRRVLYYAKYQDVCVDSLRIIEGIGPVNGYLFTEAIGACDMGPGQHSFNCANIITCSYPTSCSPAVSLAIDEIKPTSFTITAFQNNSSAILYFSSSVSGNFELRDVFGRICFSSTLTQTKEFSVSTIEFKKGVYFVQLHTNKGNYTKKILIE